MFKRDGYRPKVGRAQGSVVGATAHMPETLNGSQPAASLNYKRRVNGAFRAHSPTLVMSVIDGACDPVTITLCVNMEDTLDE